MIEITENILYCPACFSQMNLMGEILNLPPPYNFKFRCPICGRVIYDKGYKIIETKNGRR